VETFNKQKARYRRTFLPQRRKFSEARTAWLTWEDSNFDLPTSKNAFEMSAEFPLFWLEIRLGDFRHYELRQ
jgi:hypothetical protein